MENVLNTDFEIIDRRHVFIDSQIRQIRSGGLAVIMRKIGKLLVFMAKCILVAPSALGIFLLGPFRLVRFLRLDSERIGHFANIPEMYLYECSKGMHPTRRVDVFYHGPSICNIQLQKLLKRKLFIFPWPTLDWYLDSVVFLLCRCFPGGKQHAITLKDDSHDVSRSLYGLPPYFGFHAEEERSATEALQGMGIPPGAQYICIYGRDSAYLNKMIPQGDWAHHDVRDNDIQSYMPMAEKMASKGYHVVRMGKIVKSPLATSNSKIVDYATNGCRSDLLDIYLPGHCRFFIGVPGGLVAVPAVFRRPIGYVDMVNIYNLFYWDMNGIFITKKMWLRREKRLLNFREMIALKSQHDIVGLVRGGTVEVVNNTPEEIEALAVEIDQRIEGIWKAREEDEVLQQRFRLLFDGASIQNPDNRIGAEFLRVHQALLN